MKTFTYILVAACALCLPGWGQDSPSLLPESYIALLRSNIQSKKTTIVAENLTLSDDQASKFWPLQRSFESDLAKLGDQRLEVIRDFAKSWDNLSDETATNLWRRLEDYHKKRLELRAKYFDRISKGVSPVIAAKYFQIETQLEDILDLEIASEVPLIK